MDLKEIDMSGCGVESFDSGQGSVTRLPKTLINLRDA
jgi:hypothetical protein